MLREILYMILKSILFQLFFLTTLDWLIYYKKFWRMKQRNEMKTMTSFLKTVCGTVYSFYIFCFCFSFKTYIYKWNGFSSLRLSRKWKIDFFLSKTHLLNTRFLLLIFLHLLSFKVSISVFFIFHFLKLNSRWNYRYIYIYL